MGLIFHSLSPFKFFHKVRQFLKTRTGLEGFFKWWTKGFTFFLDKVSTYNFFRIFQHLLSTPLFILMKLRCNGVENHRTSEVRQGSILLHHVSFIGVVLNRKTLFNYILINYNLTNCCYLGFEIHCNPNISSHML